MVLREVAIQSTLPMYWFSLLGFGIPIRIFPQGSLVAGIYFWIICNADELNSAGLTWFPGNVPPAGFVNVRALARQVDDSSVLKSPARDAAVGTKKVLVGGAVRVRVP